jgi:alkanesulfonate monooxygenase SsuD/methylene tetrahydromethanopterin reductase-like flavin-dependent oxidoreductase (luciferase family)
VSPTSVHHPALLANRAVTIDHISNGRMVLGVGAGWQINEHHAYGIELQAPKERVDRFEEAVFVMRSMLSEERTNFSGSYYTITDAPADPKPIQSPLPILVGTSSPRMLRITARFADEWNTWGNPALAAENHQKLTYACGSLGFDPSRMQTSVQAMVLLTDSSAAASEALNGPMGARTIAGSAGELQEQLGKYAETGFDEFIVPEFNVEGPIDARLEQLQRLYDDVLTAV